MATCDCPNGQAELGMLGTGLPASKLLDLPFELRQKVFEDVFRSGSFPPRKCVSPNRLFGLVGPQYKMFGSSASDNSTVQSLTLCRQLYEENLLMPLQVNPISIAPVMGSNLAATSQFLNRLLPVQRRAIRSLELHLLASVAETWTLRSILRSIVAGDNDINMSNGSQQEVEFQSDLQELSIYVTSRDMLLAGADSLTGLLHLIDVPACSETSIGTAVTCSASWIAQGLAHFQHLRRLTITIEASAAVLRQLAPEDKSGFSNHVQETLPDVQIVMRWLPASGMQVIIDDDDWIDVPGSSSDHEAGLSFGYVGY